MILKGATTHFTVFAQLPDVYISSATGCKCIVLSMKTKEHHIGIRVSPPRIEMQGGRKEMKQTKGFLKGWRTEAKGQRMKEEEGKMKENGGAT